MKNLELTSIGVHEMSTTEMLETDGGIIWLLIVGGALLLGATSCNNNNTYNITFGDGNKNDIKNNGTMSADSNLNGNDISTDLKPFIDK